ncbi:gluconokinase-like protein [Tanacetum coccineum]
MPLYYVPRMKHQSLKELFSTMIQRNLQAPVISVRTDRGTEFLNKTLNAFFKEEGIEHQLLLLNSENQNGVIQQFHPTGLDIHFGPFYEEFFNERTKQEESHQFDRLDKSVNIVAKPFGKNQKGYAQEEDIDFEESMAQLLALESSGGEFNVQQPDGFRDPDHPDKVYRLRKLYMELKLANVQPEEKPGEMLGKSLDCSFIDADDFHPQSNKEKMKNGVPLSDQDRTPWLETLRDIVKDYLVSGKTAILGCSALQKHYRDILRSADPNFQEGVHDVCFVKFVLLDVRVNVLMERVQKREAEGKHFMPAELLQSQIDLLMVDDSEGIIKVDASSRPEAIILDRQCLYEEVKHRKPDGFYNLQVLILMLIGWDAPPLDDPHLVISAESDYMRVANAVAETVLLSELHSPLHHVILVYCDNVIVIHLTVNPVRHLLTKHIEIDIHFVLDMVARCQIRVLNVASRYQYVDIFTKGLLSTLFEKFRTSLSVRAPPAPTAREC